MIATKNLRSSWIVRLGVLYVGSWFLSLLVWDTYFWDDWFNYFGQTAQSIRNSTGPFSGVFPPMVFLQGFMAEYFPPSFRIFAFIAYPLSAVALWGVLRKSSRVTRNEAVALVILFLLMPTNSARLSMTIFRYTSANLFFFIGWWLYARGSTRLSRIAALALLILSFDTASFIVFMVAPLGLSLLEALDRNVSIIAWIRRNIVFILAGPACWFIEPMLNPTVDPVRADYYSPSLSGLSRGVLLGFVVIAIGGWIRLRKGFTYESHRSLLQIYAGIFLVWLGMFPYMALGHFPNVNSLLIGFVPGASDWDSRHQLLLPLGLALLIVGLANALNSHKLFSVVWVAAVAGSLLNFTYSHEYYVDSIKITRIIESLRSNEDIREVHFALIDDTATRFNARGRTIRSYEWDAMLEAANPDLHQKTDVLRYVDCAAIQPDAIISIRSSHGKLRTLVLRDPGISLLITPIAPCRP